MIRADNSQLELFENTNTQETAKSSGSAFSLFGRIRAYEKTILIVIGISFVSIASFSLGVERGKRLSSIRTDRYDLAMRNAPAVSLKAATEQKQVTASAPVTTQQITQDRKTALPALNLSQGYVIQLASYKAKASAQQEAKILEKRGYSPLILSKGKFSVLCVGNFADKEAAQSLLTQLKKRYKDCYVRRL